MRDPSAANVGVRATGAVAADARGDGDDALTHAAEEDSLDALTAFPFS